MVDWAASAEPTPATPAAATPAAPATTPVPAVTPVTAPTAPPAVTPPSAGGFGAIPPAPAPTPEVTPPVAPTPPAPEATYPGQTLEATPPPPAIETPAWGSTTPEPLGTPVNYDPWNPTPAPVAAPTTAPAWGSATTTPAAAPAYDPWAAYQTYAAAEDPWAAYQQAMETQYGSPTTAPVAPPTTTPAAATPYPAATTYPATPPAYDTPVPDINYIEPPTTTDYEAQQGVPAATTYPATSPAYPNPPMSTLPLEAPPFYNERPSYLEPPIEQNPVAVNGLWGMTPPPPINLADNDPNNPNYAGYTGAPLATLDDPYNPGWTSTPIDSLNYLPMDDRDLINDRPTYFPRDEGPLQIGNWDIEREPYRNGRGPLLETGTNQYPFLEDNNLGRGPMNNEVMPTIPTAAPLIDNEPQYSQYWGAAAGMDGLPIRPMDLNIPNSNQNREAQIAEALRQVSEAQGNAQFVGQNMDALGVMREPYRNDRGPMPMTEDIIPGLPQNQVTQDYRYPELAGKPPKIDDPMPLNTEQSPGQQDADLNLAALRNAQSNGMENGPQPLPIEVTSPTRLEALEQSVARERTNLERLVNSGEINRDQYNEYITRMENTQKFENGDREAGRALGLEDEEMDRNFENMELMDRVDRGDLTPEEADNIREEKYNAEEDARINALPKPEADFARWKKSNEESERRLDQGLRERLQSGEISEIEYQESQIDRELERMRADSERMPPSMARQKADIERNMLQLAQERDQIGQFANQTPMTSDRRAQLERAITEMNSGRAQNMQGIPRGFGPLETTRPMPEAENLIGSMNNEPQMPNQQLGQRNLDYNPRMSDMAQNQMNSGFNNLASPLQAEAQSIELSAMNQREINDRLEAEIMAEMNGMQSNPYSGGMPSFRNAQRIGMENGPSPAYRELSPERSPGNFML